MKLTVNEGTADRIMRVAIGLGILSLTFFGPKTLWGLVGLVPIVTGAVGFCPMYTFAGIDTCSGKKRDAAPQS